MAPLYKCLSMNGPAHAYEPHHNDYRFWGNRDIVIAAGCRYVKLWVSWFEIQQNYQPSSNLDSWNWLSTNPDAVAQFARLDAQIKQANNDGVHVILTLYQANPTWAAAPGMDYSFGRPIQQKFPANRASDGPWAWFVSYLLGRYKVGGGGNPLGAAVTFLEPLNEPNFVWWPQWGVESAVADLVNATADHAAFWGWHTTGQGLLIPGTSDAPDPPWSTANDRRWTDWQTLTQRVLDQLTNFRPPMYVGWSHHNYRDIRGTNWQGSPAYRVAGVRQLLLSKNWRGGGDRRVYISEGGWQLDHSQTPLGYVGNQNQEPNQAFALAYNHGQMRDLTGPYIWTTHGVNDTFTNTYKTQLRREMNQFVWPWQLGAERVAYGVFRDLPRE